jgi:hypothetical protein
MAEIGDTALAIVDSAALQQHELPKGHEEELILPKRLASRVQGLKVFVVER